MKLLQYLPRFRRAYQELDLLASRESWSRQAIEAYQLESLNRLWMHASRHVPYYRELVQRFGLPKSFASIAGFQSQMPMLSKTTVATHASELLSETAGKGQWLSTSGSTGTPTRVFAVGTEHQAMLRAKYRSYASWGVDILDRMAWLWTRVDAGSASAVTRCRQQLQDRLRNRLRLSAAKLDPASLCEYLRQIEAFRPAGIYGFSRALYLLAVEARQAGFRCDSLRFICMTGETANRQMKSNVETAMGAPAVMEYGSVECGFLAGEDSSRSLRARADIAIIETVPRQDGLFDIVVTSLTKYAFPLLRYRIGDVTDQPIMHPERGFPILASIAGRNDDVLVTRSGGLIHATAVDELFEHSGQPILRYRVHQAADGSVLASVVPWGDKAQIDLADIAACLTRLMEGFKVVVKLTSSIEQTRAGKHRLVTSDRAQALARSAGNVEADSPTVH